MSNSGFKSGQSTYKAIILPFDSRWMEPLRSGAVTVVFRKKGPSSKASPQWAYAYIGAPTSAIVAKLSITRIEYLAIGDAVTYCEEGALSEDQLRKYAGVSQTLCVFHLGQRIVSKHPIGMAELAERFGFLPSPSFVALSDDGIRQLDDVLKIKR